MRRLQFESLESRAMMCGDLLEGEVVVIDGNLHAAGTEGDDLIRVYNTAPAGTMRVDINGDITTIGGMAPNYTGEVVLCGLGGNDRIISYALNNSRMYGGDGNDTLADYVGDSILIGGEGNDNLQGRGGDDALVGGTGRDTLSGGAGNDIAFHNRLVTINGDESSDEAMEEVRSLWATNPAAVLAILDYDALEEEDDELDKVLGQGNETIFSGIGDY